MAELCVRPKNTPVIFIVIRHTMTVVSIALCAISIYVVKSSATVTKTYANLLVLLLLGSMSVDVFVQWVIDPAFILTRACSYRRAPLLNLPLSAAVCMSLLHSLVGAGGPVYLSLFIYRHQSIVPHGSRFKFSRSTLVAFLSGFLLYSLMFGISIYHMSEDWSASVLERIDCIDIWHMRMYWFFCATVPAFAALFIAAQGLVSYTFVSLKKVHSNFIIEVAQHTFLLIRDVKNVSLKTQKLHRILTISLVAQALVPVIFVILPFVLAIGTCFLLALIDISIIIEMG